MPVKPTYFKFRNRFDFSPHRYDIGRAIFQNRAVEDNFFLLKIYEILIEEFGPYYFYQLGHYLKANPADEEVFFTHVRDIVIERIKHFKRQDPFSTDYAANMKNAHKLEAFHAFILSIDKWNISKPLETVINEKDELINQLKERVKVLEVQIEEFGIYEADEKIVINKDSLQVFLDLMQQLQELTLPNGNKLLRSQAYSPWYKMIAKYFVHGEKQIPLPTAQHYFCSPASSKYIWIAKKHKLFKITPVKKD